MKYDKTAIWLWIPQGHSSDDLVTQSWARTEQLSIVNKHNERIHDQRYPNNESVSWLTNTTSSKTAKRSSSPKKIIDSD